MNDYKVMEDIEGFILTAANVSVIIVMKDGKNQRVRMTDDVANGFRELALSFVGREVKKISEFYDYEPWYIPEEHECTVLTVADEPILEDAINKSKVISSLRPFVHEKKSLRKIKHYIIAVEDNSGNSVYIYDTFGDANILDRKGKYPIVFGKRVSKKLEKGLVFSDNMGCIVWKGHVFIFNQAKFEKIFDYLESLKQIALQEAEKIGKKLHIENIDEFNRVVNEDIGIIRKLVEMKNNESTKKLEYAKMKTAIENFRLEVEFHMDRTVNGKPIIEFESDVKRRWQFFKLLGEDYFVSEVTDNKFMASSKRRVEAGEEEQPKKPKKFFRKPEKPKLGTVRVNV